MPEPGSRFTRPPRERRAITSVAQWTPIVALAFLAAHGWSADIPAPGTVSTLTNLGQVRVLSRTAARTKPPVIARGVVTYYEPRWDTLFVQDGSNGVYVASTPGVPRPPFRAGQWVEVQGTVDTGYVPLVRGENIRVLGEAPLPAPVSVTLDMMTGGFQDAQFVEIEGVIRAMRIEWNRLLLEVAASGGRFFAHLPAPDPPELPRHLLDARVALRGVSGMILNKRAQVVGARLFVPELDQVRVLSAPPADPFALPGLGTNDLAGEDPRTVPSQRVRVRGIVTLHWASGMVFVRNNEGGVQVRLGNNPHSEDASAVIFPRYQHPPIKLGDHVEAVGFPVLQDFAPVLEDSQVRVLGQETVPAPVSITVSQALSGEFDSELVQMTGRILEIAPRSASLMTERRLLLEADEKVFEARLEAFPDTIIKVPPGSTVRLAGICLTASDEQKEPVDFRLLLRSPEDIEVLRTPPRWLTGEVLRVLGVAAIVVLALAGWAVALRRRVHTQGQHITTLKREAELQQKFRETQQLLSSVTQNISDGIYRSTPARGLIYMNEAFVKMFGYSSPEEIVRVPSTNLYANPAAREHLVTLIQRDGRFVNEEVEFVRKDGSHFWGLASSIGIYDPDSGNLVYFDGAITDITERKRMQDELQQMNVALERRIAERTTELRETEARFAKAFRSSPLFMTIARLDNGKFVEANDAMVQGSGWSREEIIGRSTADLGLWVDPQQRQRLMEDLRRDGFVRSRESTMRLKSGQIIIALLSAEIIEINHEPHILAVTIDITARKRAEAELVRSLEREKELNQLKSNFVSMVSHEFRTPLGIINSSSQILQRYLDRLSPEQRAEHLGSINKSVRRMASMMEEVLVLSKVEAGQVACKPEEVELASFCRRLTDEMLSATNHRCPIVLQVIDPLPACADENLLRHIFTNLISNGVKFSPPGRSVIFEVSRSDGTAIFRVRDEGLGIPAADRDRLFKAFHRGQNTAGISGTGLGLTIVKRCVDLHGGQITVHSEEGQGTTFTVTLPLHAKAT